MAPDKSCYDISPQLPPTKYNIIESNVKLILMRSQSKLNVQCPTVYLAGFHTFRYSSLYFHTSIY